LIEPFHFVVLTPAETLLDVSMIQRIQLRIADGGGLSIYPGHAPLLAETLSGAVTYVNEGGEHQIEVEAGILHVTPEQVLILVPGALQHGERERPAVREARDRRFERLASTLLEMLREEPELTGDQAT